MQLNTVTRPSAEDFADYRGLHAQSEFQAGESNVLAMIRRRPCSLGDIANGVGMHRNEVVRYIEELDAGGLLETRLSAGKLFYHGTQEPQETRS